MHANHTGPTLALDAVTKELGLGKVLDRGFPETSGQILAMAYHLVCRGDGLLQISLALLFGQKSMLPVSYRELPGNISDVKTLKNLLDTFGKLGMPTVHLVMDRGFYSKKNVDDLLAEGHKFEIGVPLRCKWLQDLVDQQRDDMQLPQNMKWIGGEMVYAVTCLHSWGEDRKRCTVHLYYNHQTVGDTISDFNGKLLTS
ncbi:MAG: transposase [Caldiserica bacterium]|nr:transposase [Caldisericota bacterium]